jgi:hypothetical protein
MRYMLPVLSPLLRGLGCAILLFKLLQELMELQLRLGLQMGLRPFDLALRDSHTTTTTVVATTIDEAGTATATAAVTVDGRLCVGLLSGHLGLRVGERLKPHLHFGMRAGPTSGPTDCILALRCAA